LPEQVILPTPALAKEMDLNVTLPATRVEPEETLIPPGVRDTVTPLAIVNVLLFKIEMED
jgi:hypothetical protein